MRSIASLIVIALAVHTSAAQPPKKQLKDQTEHDLYNRAIDADDPARQIEALDRWSERYPASDYRDDRLYLYMQAYNKLDQPEKVIDYGGRLMSRGLRALFNTPEDGMVVLNVLFLLVRSVARLPSPAEVQLSLGHKAAADLLEFASTYKPANTSEADWTKAREDIEERTRAAVIAIAMAPGNQAMAKNPPDCAAASAAWSGPLAQHPRSALLAYSLGKALACEGRMPQAFYQFVRAAELDASLGGTADPEQIAEYVRRAYISYHGDEEGLDKLKALAKNSPQPPADFAIETAAEIAARKHSEFIKNHPQAAFWLAIKAQLESPTGVQYFEGQLKNALVAGKDGTRALKGTVIEGRPSCRPKELLLSMGGTARPELTIRLDSPPAGVVVRSEIEFDAVPRLFTRDPLHLTVDSSRMQITNLKIGPCP